MGNMWLRYRFFDKIEPTFEVDATRKFVDIIEIVIILKFVNFI